MNFKTWRMGQLIATFAGLALLSAGCGLMAPKAEHYVAPALGTIWANSVARSGSFGSGTVQTRGKRGERMLQGSPMIEFEGAAGTILARPNGDWLGMYKGDTPMVTWDPPLHWEWPIEVGKSWTRAQRVTNHATKQTTSYEITQKVEAYEDVTVPAGTFKTFRISTVNTLGDDNMVWFSPNLGIFVKQVNKRTDKHALGAGTQTSELIGYTRGTQ
jgi:hypothetical protein